LPPISGWPEKRGGYIMSAIDQIKRPILGKLAPVDALKKMIERRVGFFQNERAHYWRKKYGKGISRARNSLNLRSSERRPPLSPLRTAARSQRL